MKLYPCGYTRSPAWIMRLMREQPHLILVDTRFKPWSRMPAWRAAALQATYGPRYRWVGETLGNRNYRGGPIDLVDPISGLAVLDHWLEHGQDLLLLCGCANYEHCHVKTIVEALCAQMPGIEVVMPEPAGEQTRMALSLRQPWAWLLTHPEEVAACGIPPLTLVNRTWTTRYRGPLLLHAGALEPFFFDRRGGLLLSGYWMMQFGRSGEHLVQMMPSRRDDYTRHAMVGEAELVDVVRESTSPWFVGPYGLVLAHARAITPPVKYPGRRRLFAISDVLADLTGEENES